jgi:hypothetical protein
MLPVAITAINVDDLQGKILTAPVRLPYLHVDQVVTFEWVNILKVLRSAQA